MSGPLDRSANPSANPSARVVETRRLTYAYPDGSVALRDLSLEVRRGEMLGLLGPNGSGKSTFLRLVGGAFPGIALSDSVGSPKDRLFSPDQPVFREWLTGRENVIALLRLRGLRSAAARAAADEWLDELGLRDDAERSVGTYSRGMRRRLALALAFGAETRLLLLDEPLAGLDPGGRARLAAALEGFHERGGTAVLSTHEPEFAAKHCDRVAFLVEGRVEAADAPDRLLAAIGSQPRIAVRFAEGGEPTPGELGPRPAGIEEDIWADGSVTLVVEDARRALPDALAWVLAAGAEVASVDVRQPTLEDAFLEVTGRRLDEMDAR